MSQFGHELRRERESRGIALGNITGATKISERHLVALEEERFDVLPGGVLSKGIVRGYARAVGLDEEAWIGRYLSAYHQSGQLKDDDVAWMEFAENVGRARKPGDEPDTAQRLRWAGVALLLTLLAIFSWYVAHFVSGRVASQQIGSLPALLSIGIGPLKKVRLARSLSRSLSRPAHARLPSSKTPGSLAAPCCPDPGASKACASAGDTPTLQ